LDLGLKPALFLWVIFPLTKGSQCAWRTVATNEGKRTPGIDEGTIKDIHQN